MTSGCASNPKVFRCFFGMSCHYCFFNSALLKDLWGFFARLLKQILALAQFVFKVAFEHCHSLKLLFFYVFFRGLSCFILFLSLFATCLLVGSGFDHGF